MSAALIDIEGTLFALGSLNAWRDQPRPPAVVSPHWLGVAHSATRKGFYAIKSEAKNPRALAPALAQLHPRAVYCVDDISDLADGAAQAWLCQILDGRVATDTDTLYPLDDERAQQRLQDDLADAAQLTDTAVYHLGSGRELVATLIAPLAEVDLSICGIHPPRPARWRTLSAAFASLLVLAGLAWWQGLRLPAPDTGSQDLSGNTTQVLQATFAAEIDRLATQIPLIRARPYLQHALALPHEMLGFRVTRVDCDTRRCLTTYTRANARLITPVLAWAHRLDPGATYSPATDTLLLTRTLAPANDATPSRASRTDVAHRWADARALTSDLGIALTVTAPTPITGAEAAGVDAWQGTWDCANVEPGALLALTETLGAIAGVRLARLNWTDHTLTLGGAYAFEQL